ncbi:hypothetical protein [Corynebacterium urogenitale]
MAHYNLYDTLRVDRDADSQSLAREIDERIERQDFSNPGGLDELQIARQILGDSGKKAEYDSRIADESGEEVNIAALRQIAAGESNQQSQFPNPPGAGQQEAYPQGGQPGYQQPQYSGPQDFSQAPQGQYGQQPQQFQQGYQPQGQFDSNQQGYAQQPQQFQQGQFAGQPGQPQQQQGPGAKEKFAAATAGLKKTTGEKTAKLRGEFKKSSKSAIIATAVFTLAACLLVWGVVAGIGHFTSGERKAENVAKELLKTENQGEMKDWVRKYSLDSTKEDNLNLIDNRDVSTPSDLFDTGAPGVQRVDNSSAFMGAVLAGESRSDLDEEERQFFEAAEEGNLYFVSISSNDGEGEVVGGMMLGIVDGDAKLIAVGEASDFN